MNARGEIAACRAALTTSVAGASLPTKPDAPACMAAKIWSSPECMVSTTRPVVSLWPRMLRTMSRPVPSGSCRSATTTAGFSSS